MSSRPSVLWLTASALVPQRSGGVQRSFHLLEGCLRAGQRLEVWQPGLTGPPDGWNAVSWRRYQPRSMGGRAEKARTLLAAMPIPSWHLRVPALRRAVLDSTHDVVVADQHVGVALLPELTKRALPFVHLSHGVEWRLSWSIARSRPSAYLAVAHAADAAKARAWERRVAGRASVVAATSERDAATYRNWRARRVEVIPSGATLPSGPPHEVREQASRLLFIGSLAYWPNVDACRFLAAEVMPRVRSVVPNASVDVVGQAPAEEVARLHAPQVGIRVIGEVHEVGSWLRSADVVVVPMRLGHGTRLKVLEAMAHGVPVVATRIADEGLDLGMRGAVVATEPSAEHISEGIVRVLRDRALRQQLSGLGRRIVADSFQWSDMGDRFAELVAVQARLKAEVR